MLVLLDRDGVLNLEPPDRVISPDQLELIDGAAEAVARLNAAGHTVVVATNQSIVGRGVIDSAMLECIHDRLSDLLAAKGGRLDDILSCTDAPWAATARRKPGPDMLLEALARYQSKPAATPFIGDDVTDLEAAARAGCRRILVRTGKGRTLEAEGPPDHVLPVAVYDDLGAAVDALLGEHS